MPPGDLYGAALRDYRSGKYDMALQGFASFLKWYPSEPLAADAMTAAGPARVGLVWLNSPANPTGRVLAIWNQMLGGKIVKVYWPGGDGLITAYATLNPNKSSLNVFVVNRDLHARESTLQLDNFNSLVNAALHTFSGSGPDDLKPVFRLADPVTLKSGRTALHLPPSSLTVLTIPTQEDTKGSLQP